MTSCTSLKKSNRARRYSKAERALSRSLISLQDLSSYKRELSQWWIKYQKWGGQLSSRLFSVYRQCDHACQLIHPQLTSRSEQEGFPSSLPLADPVWRQETMNTSDAGEIFYLTCFSAPTMWRAIARPGHEKLRSWSPAMRNWETDTFEKSSSLSSAS